MKNEAVKKKINVDDIRH